MKNTNIVFKYAGVICIPIYIIFTFISSRYNPNLNPLANWLSDFGNPFLNPSGAFLYNLGCIIVAVLLAVFCIGIYQWYRNCKIRKYIICYVGAQISGIIASIFLLLASIFPLGINTKMHGISSWICMIGMDSFLSFIALAFLFNPNIKKWIGITAYISAVFNIVTMNMFSALYIAEWIYFLLFMIHMVIITLNYKKIVQYESLLGEQNSEGSDLIIA